MKRLKNLLFVLLLALLAWNCQKDDAPVPDPTSVVKTQAKTFKGRRTIALGEVPDIEGFLSTCLSKRKGYTFKKNNGDSSDMVITPFGQIPLEDILEVSDSQGNFNYTFRILPSSYIGNRFYNLVVHKRDGEKEIKAFVLEYNMNENFAQEYMSKTSGFGQFTGMIRTYGFEVFLDHQDKRANTTKACEEEDGPFNLSPCEEYEVENGEPGEPDDMNPAPGGDLGEEDPAPSPGDGGGGGDGSGGGDPEVVCVAGGLYVTDCEGSNSDELHAAGSCQGPNKMGANFYMQYNCSDGSTTYQDLKAGDCSDGGAGPVGIAPVSFYSLSFALGLDFVERQWLESHCDLKNDLYQFLNSHLDEEGEWQQEAKGFAKEALDAAIAMENNSWAFEQDYKGQMSLSEIAIYDSMSIFKQAGYLLNAQKAIWASEDLYPHSFYNGKGDAFRHAYFNGLNAILLGPILAEDLATAHEDKPAPPNYPNYFKEVQMDLFNNQVGRDKMNWLVDGYDSLTESILEALTNGELRYLSNLQGNGASGRATNQSQLIPTN